MSLLKMFVAQFYYFINRSFFGFGYFADRKSTRLNSSHR